MSSGFLADEILNSCVCSSPLPGANARLPDQKGKKITTKHLTVKAPAGLASPPKEKGGQGGRERERELVTWLVGALSPVNLRGVYQG